MAVVPVSSLPHILLLSVQNHSHLLIRPDNRITGLRPCAVQNTPGIDIINIILLSDQFQIHRGKMLLRHHIGIYTQHILICNILLKIQSYLGCLPVRSDQTDTYSLLVFLEIIHNVGAVYRYIRLVLPFYPFHFH